ncbi:MAG: vWA domain-containing protein [Bdellovibrionota bacterium]
MAHTVEEEAFQGEDLGERTDELRALFLKHASHARSEPSLDKRLVDLVLSHARSIVSHPAKPMRRELLNFYDDPAGEIALEESLEENPALDGIENLWVERQAEKTFPCVTMLDCSFSMAGDKHLLSSIAVAVLLLEVPVNDTSLVVFGSQAKSLKALREQQPRETTVLEFLKHKPAGFTNIARGLEEGLSQLAAGRASKRKIGILATDGRSTEGEDPLEVARRFDQLVVLHLHGPGSHLEASQKLAEHGGGTCLEVEEFAQLPRRLYEALRVLARA